MLQQANLSETDFGGPHLEGCNENFGYPACPALEDQAGIWMLLDPEEIGVHLTEGMMMDPEASVSALVFHHPDCAYFSVGDQQIES
jgi:5-methyltetrahydrofolate--homocysteine methyltransferase